MLPDTPDLRLYRIKINMDPHDIFYLSWTISSYEGIGYLTTDDPEKGLVSVFTPYRNKDIMKKVLEEISEEGTVITIFEETIE